MGMHLGSLKSLVHSQTVLDPSLSTKPSAWRKREAARCHPQCRPPARTTVLLLASPLQTLLLSGILHLARVRAQRKIIYRAETSHRRVLAFWQAQVRRCSTYTQMLRKKRRQRCQTLVSTRAA